jgi:hypothetical protein
MVLDKTKIYHEPSELSKPIITHLHYCVTQVQKKHSIDKNFRTQFRGGRDIWAETFKMLGKPSPIKNQDHRMFFRFNSNSFIVKSHFTFGIQKVEANHKHLIQLTKNGLLCYVCNGTGPLKSNGLPKDIKTENRVFPYHQHRYYQQFKFLPEQKYIIPEHTQYLLIAPTWVCFSFHKVNEDFSPPFQCIDLQTLINDNKKMPPPPTYDPSMIQPATPAWDQTVSHVKPPDAEHLEAPPSKRQKTLDDREVVLQTPPADSAADLESATTSQDVEPPMTDILAQSFIESALSDPVSDNPLYPLTPICDQLEGSGDPIVSVKTTTLTASIEQILPPPPPPSNQNLPAPSCSFQNFTAPSSSLQNFPAPSSSLQTFTTPSSSFQNFTVPSSPFQTFIAPPPVQNFIAPSPVQNFIAPSPIQNVMAPHLLSPFIQNLSTPFPPPPPPCIYNSFHNFPTPLAPIFNNSNFQTPNPFGMPFNNSYQGQNFQLPCSQILNYVPQPYRYTCHCQQPMNVPPPQTFVPPQINYCETTQIQEFGDNALTSAASSSTTRILSSSDTDQLLDMLTQ